MVQVATVQATTTVSGAIEAPGPAIEALRGLPRRGAILLVEDHDDMRIGLAQLLELNGFVVRTAVSGEQALRFLAAEADALALILLDLVLAGSVSGRDVRAWQLADPETATVPTVVVSACEPEALAQAQLRPAAWLEKPFRLE